MQKNVREKDLVLFADLSREPRPETPEQRDQLNDALSEPAAARRAVRPLAEIDADLLRRRRQHPQDRCYYGRSRR